MSEKLSDFICWVCIFLASSGIAPCFYEGSALMPEVKTQPRCAWELCNKKLIDLAFICKADDRLFCDETCCERALQEETPRARFLWQ
jgi:hypothetical protein